MSDEEVRLATEIRDLVKLLPSISCFYACCPCCVDDKQYQKIKSILIASGRRHNIAYRGTMVMFAEFESNAPFKTENPKTLQLSFDGDWRINGVPTDDEMDRIIKLREKIWLPCRSNRYELFLPWLVCDFRGSIAENILLCLCATILPHEQVGRIFSKAFLSVTAPCWSCCETTRINPGEMNQLKTVCCAIVSFSMDVNGYDTDLSSVVLFNIQQ